jgi:hypothetical protein
MKLDDYVRNFVDISKLPGDLFTETTVAEHSINCNDP